MALNEVWNEIVDEVIVQSKTVTELADTTVNNTFDATNSTQTTGFVYTSQFTGLTLGEFINSISLKVTTAAGNVRIKIYGDNAGEPDILLGESQSLSVSGTGIQAFTLIKKVEVPIDGIIWASFENDNASLDISETTGESSGTLKSVAHTYGAGPDPFGSPTNGTIPKWTQINTNAKVVKHYDVRGHQPEDYFVIVQTGEMVTSEYTNRGSINDFQILIDLSYRGVDFRDGLTKTLKVASDLYDILHLTTLNGKCRRAFIQSMTPEEIDEGQNLYLTMIRLVLMCERAVIQP